MFYVLLKKKNHLYEYILIGLQHATFFTQFFPTNFALEAKKAPNVKPGISKR